MYLSPTIRYDSQVEYDVINIIVFFKMGVYKQAIITLLSVPSFLKKIINNFNLP